MATKKKNNRYIKMQSESTKKVQATKHLNFGFFIFVMIFAYLVFIMVSFAVKEKVSYTIAELGVLSNAHTYEGMVIRNETVVSSDASGDIRYFSPEGARIRNDNNICAVISDPDYVKLLDEKIFKANQTLKTDNETFDESYNYLQNRIKNYVINQHNKKFATTYDIKRQLENDISDIRNTVIVQQTDMGLSSSANLIMLEDEKDKKMTMLKAPNSGLVSYVIDGMEDINMDTFKFSDLNRKPKIQDITTKSVVSKDQHVFKVVDNYLWYMIAEINDEAEKLLEDQSYKTLYFTEKDIKLVVKIEVIDEGEKTYLKITADRQISDFLTDRFVDFNIIYEDHEGIKVPETAVTSKLFAVIPEAYFGYLNNQYGVYKKVASTDAPGENTIDFTVVRQFKKLDDQVYVPIQDNLNVGDVLSYTDSETLATTEYVIKDTEEMDGVYVVNKGYAAFKFIDTTYKEADYRIVEPYASYGIRISDKIATEADKLSEDEIIN